jgi:putative pyruvate formate lyase activating enzyme
MNSDKCIVCPRKCMINRDNAVGFCRVGNQPIVAKAYLHMWEEPCVSGTRGSGTVFFSGCNLRCVFCQNYKISQECFGEQVTIEKLGKIFLSLQEKGAHNINLVSPTHYLPQISECLSGIKGLNIPIIYNSNGYENVETVKQLKGYVNVYMPDLKYMSSELSLKYSGARDYFGKATSAIKEMYEQAGGVEFDDNGLIKKGLVIRHLILPGLSSESIKVLDWIKTNMPQDIIVSVMSQYTPCYKAESCPEINRRITRWEYGRVIRHFKRLEFKYGYFQERDSASEDYIPDFNLEGID